MSKKKSNKSKVTLVKKVKKQPDKFAAIKVNKKIKSTKTEKSKKNSDKNETKKPVKKAKKKVVVNKKNSPPVEENPILATEPETKPQDMNEPHIYTITEQDVNENKQRALANGTIVVGINTRFQRADEKHFHVQGVLPDGLTPFGMKRAFGTAADANALESELIAMEKARGGAKTPVAAPVAGKKEKATKPGKFSKGKNTLITDTNVDDFINNLPTNPNEVKLPPSTMLVPKKHVTNNPSNSLASPANMSVMMNEGQQSQVDKYGKSLYDTIMGSVQVTLWHGMTPHELHDLFKRSSPDYKYELKSDDNGHWIVISKEGMGARIPQDESAYLLMREG